MIERVHSLGVLVSGSKATLEHLTIRDVLPRVSDDTLGRGVQFQEDIGLTFSSEGTLAWSVIERVNDAGLLVGGASVTIDGVRVLGTSATSQSLFGDGIVAYLIQNDSNAVITTSWVGPSARAGIASFGARVPVGGTTIGCNAFDLDVEVTSARTGAFDDLGGNRCGCDELLECRAVSAQLSAPEPIVDPD